MTPGRIVLLVFGIIFTLVAIPMMAGGGALVWANQAFKDNEGFLATNTVRLASSSHAITTDTAHIEVNWLPADFATVRVEGSSNNPAKQVFIGIAGEADVTDYLDGVDYDEISEFRMYPYRISYTDHPGSAIPEAPTAHTFWEASAYGPGTQTLQWELQPGDWVLVLMNTDGSAGIDLRGAVGAKVPWIFSAGLGLLIVGMILLGAGVLMIVFAVRRPPPGARTNVPHAE